MSSSETHYKLVKFLSESHEVSVRDVLSVYSPLLTDKNKTIFRIVPKDKSGFLEVYRYNGTSKTTGVVVLGVSPLHQCKGVGTALLKRAIESARKRGLKKLIYRIDSYNEPSKKLIQKFVPYPTRVFKSSEEFVINL